MNDRIVPDEPLPRPASDDLDACPAVIPPGHSSPPHVIATVERAREDPMHTAASPGSAAGRSRSPVSIQAGDDAPDRGGRLGVLRENPPHDRGRPLVDTERRYVTPADNGRFALESEGGRAATPSIRGRGLRCEPSHDIPGEVAEELVFPFLGDGVGEPAGEVAPINHSLGDRLERHSRIAERGDPRAGLDHVESAETILIETQDPIESAAGRVADHRLESLPLAGRVARYALVDILTHDLVALLCRERDEGLALLGDRGFLPIRAHPQVENAPHRWAPFFFVAFFFRGRPFVGVRLVARYSFTLPASTSHTVEKRVASIRPRRMRRRT